MQKWLVFHCKLDFAIFKYEHCSWKKQKRKKKSIESLKCSCGVWVHLSNKLEATILWSYFTFPEQPFHFPARPPFMQTSKTNKSRKSFGAFLACFSWGAYYKLPFWKKQQKSLVCAEHNTEQWSGAKGK